jgi:hypothetical protein
MKQESVEPRTPVAAGGDVKVNGVVVSHGTLVPRDQAHLGIGRASLEVVRGCSASPISEETSRRSII